jgi:hypothetical protein
MATLELKIDPATVRQGILPDGRGGWREDQILWHGVTELRWDAKSLPIRLEARSSDTDRSESTRERWSFLLNNAAARRLRDGVLRPFAANDVAVDVPTRLRSKTATLSVRIDKSALAQWDEAYEQDQLARRSFKYAMGRIRAFAESPPPHGHSESDAYVMLSFVQQSLDAGDQGYLYGWNDEKLSGIRSYLQELTTRKNRQHPGFVRARDYILSNTSCFSPPDAWIRQPPTINTDTLAKAGA